MSASWNRAVTPRALLAAVTMLAGRVAGRWGKNTRVFLSVKSGGSGSRRAFLLSPDTEPGRLCHRWPVSVLRRFLGRFLRSCRVEFGEHFYLLRATISVC